MFNDETLRLHRWIEVYYDHLLPTLISLQFYYKIFKKKSHFFRLFIFTQFQCHMPKHEQLIFVPFAKHFGQWLNDKHFRLN